MLTQQLSEEAANALHTWSNVTLVVGAVLALAGTLGVFWSDGIRERYADRKLSDNVTATSKANEGAANAIERAASLEKEAAEARLELERLKTKLAWRTITDSDAQTFLQLVASAPKSKVAITYLTNNEEVASFTGQLAHLLGQGGYDVPPTFDGMRAIMPIGGLMLGVMIHVKDAQNAAAIALQQGLARIGIQAGGNIRTEQQEEIEIEIGAKPSSP